MKPIPSKNDKIVGVPLPYFYPSRQILNTEWQERKARDLGYNSAQRQLIGRRQYLNNSVIYAHRISKVLP